MEHVRVIASVEHFWEPLYEDISSINAVVAGANYSNQSNSNGKTCTGRYSVSQSSCQSTPYECVEAKLLWGLGVDSERRYA